MYNPQNRFAVLTLKRALNILLPFTLTLAVGILISRYVVTRVEELPAVSFPTSSRIEVRSVPRIDFTEGAKLSTGLQASIRLRAMVDHNGNVSSAVPSVMVPYGMPESSSSESEFAANTPMLLNGKFVRDLPYQLSDASIDLVRGIKFKPEIVNGIAQDHVITVIVEFYVPYPLALFCNPITATLFDDHGEFWSGNVSIYKDCGRGNTNID